MRLKILYVLIALATGRAMTLAFITRAGDGGVGDPPGPWLMPLVGDAVVGLTAAAVVVAIWKRPTPATWVVAVVWSAVGAFDAVAAFIVQTSAPWPDFFMIEIFGPSMFFAATALHLVIIHLLSQPDVLAHFGLARRGRVVEPRPA